VFTWRLSKKEASTQIIKSQDITTFLLISEPDREKNDSKTLEAAFTVFVCLYRYMLDA